MLSEYNITLLRILTLAVYIYYLKKKTVVQIKQETLISVIFINLRDNSANNIFKGKVTNHLFNAFLLIYFTWKKELAIQHWG